MSTAPDSPVLATRPSFVFDINAVSINEIKLKAPQEFRVRKENKQ